MSSGYDDHMDRMDDVGRKIDAHLKSAWGRTFLCTTQEVRESITVSLLGIRARLRSGGDASRAELLSIAGRCDDVLDQVRVLIGRKDRRHAKTFIRLVRSYQEKIAALLQSDRAAIDTDGVGGEG
jgi:hypothetical protein